MVLIRFENKIVKKVTKKVVSLLEKGGAVKTQCFNSSCCIENSDEGGVLYTKKADLSDRFLCRADRLYEFSAIFFPP